MKQATTRKIILLSAMFIGCFQFEQYASMSGKPAFEDISNLYGEPAILALSEKGIIDGTAPGKFEPNKKITRAEFVTMLNRVLKLDPVNAEVSAFWDVDSSDWFFGNVHAAMYVKVSEGTGTNSFSPNIQITRQEAAALLVRAMKQEATDDSYYGSPFEDLSEAASWAVPFINKAYELRFIEGDNGSFRPGDPITRLETAVLLNRIVSNSKWLVNNQAVTAVPIQLGWQYGQTTEQFKASVLKSTVNTLSPRWFFLDENGAFQDQAEPSLVTWAHANNKKVWPLFGNRFNMEMTHRLLTDSSLKQSIITKLTDSVRKYQLDGINVDFENLNPADRQAFTTFIGELANALHPLGAKLSVDVPPDLSSEWSDPFDYEALGQKADYIVLMGYEEHWNGSQNPGSVASIPWLVSGLSKMKAKVAPYKIIVALPLYTRDWSQMNGNTTSVDLTLREQSNIVKAYTPSIQWDDKAKQYLLFYNKSGALHRIWAEDSRSLSAKLQMAANEQAGGVAYWYVGDETADVWPSIRNMMKYSSYQFPH